MGFFDFLHMLDINRRSRQAAKLLTKMGYSNVKKSGRYRFLFGKGGALK